MSLGEVTVYLTSFGVLLAAGFGLGPPEEIALPGAGIYAGTHPEVRWWVLLPVCIVGVVIADLFLYFIGRRLGHRLLNHRWMARLISTEKRKHIEKNFHEYGLSILLFGRLMPGVRAPLFLTAGAIHLPLGRFLLADGLGAVLGNAFLFFLGYWLGDQVNQLVQQAESLKPILVIVVVGALIAFVLYKFLRHPVATGDPQQVPIVGHQLAETLHELHREPGCAPSIGPDPPPVTPPGNRQPPANAQPEDAKPPSSPPANGQPPGTGLPEGEAKDTGPATGPQV